jgi:DNA-binding NtrC family response regulator
VLRQTGWKKSEAARRLGISRPTLDSKITIYDLKRSGG